jgi:hypothetical protein
MQYSGHAIMTCYSELDLGLLKNQQLVVIDFAARHFSCTVSHSTRGSVRGFSDGAGGGGRFR